MAIKNPNEPKAEQNSPKNVINTTQGPKVDDDLDTMLASGGDDEIAQLKAQLAQTRAALAESVERESKARASSEAFANIMSYHTEVFHDEVDVTEEVWNPKTKKVELVDKTVKRFRYRLDLAPNGGQCVTLNSVPYYHGQEYVFTENELRSIKDIVHRTHVHEANIHGQNENFYRQGKNNVLDGKRYR